MSKKRKNKFKAIFINYNKNYCLLFYQAILFQARMRKDSIFSLLHKYNELGLMKCKVIFFNGL